MHHTYNTHFYRREERTKMSTEYIKNGKKMTRGYEDGVILLSAQQLPEEYIIPPPAICYFTISIDHFSCSMPFIILELSL
jgi:hypothetical protein